MLPMDGTNAAGTSMGLLVVAAAAVAEVVLVASASLPAPQSSLVGLQLPFGSPPVCAAASGLYCCVRPVVWLALPACVIVSKGVEGGGRQQTFTTRTARGGAGNCYCVSF